LKSLVGGEEEKGNRPAFARKKLSGEPGDKHRSHGGMTMWRKMVIDRREGARRPRLPSKGSIPLQAASRVEIAKEEADPNHRKVKLAGLHARILGCD